MLCVLLKILAHLVDDTCVHAWGFGGREGVSEAAKLAVDCECPYWLRCSLCGGMRLVRCGRPSVRSCGPCGDRNKSRVRRVAMSGYARGVDGLFVTLTAPSWVQHYLPNGDACNCTGGDCPDLASWNAGAGSRFNRLMQDLRRLLGEDVQYFKCAEVQRRGALHYHVLLRGDPDACGRPALALSKVELRRLAVSHGFGHSVDVQAVEPRHWGYVAKYASKAAGDRLDVPWRGLRWVGGFRYIERVDTVSGECYVIRVGTKEREQVPSARATYRTWSASRRFGDSMAFVRAAQGHFSALLAALPAWDGLLGGVPASWGFVTVPARPDMAIP